MKFPSPLHLSRKKIQKKSKGKEKYGNVVVSKTDNCKDLNPQAIVGSHENILERERRLNAEQTETEDDRKGIIDAVCKRASQTKNELEDGKATNDICNIAHDVEPSEEITLQRISDARVKQIELDQRTQSTSKIRAEIETSKSGISNSTQSNTSNTPVKRTSGPRSELRVPPISSSSEPGMINVVRKRKSLTKEERIDDVEPSEEMTLQRLSDARIKQVELDRRTQLRSSGISNATQASIHDTPSKRASPSKSELKITPVSLSSSGPLVIDAVCKRASLTKNDFLDDAEPSDEMTLQRLSDARIKQIELDRRTQPRSKITAGIDTTTKWTPPNASDAMIKRASLPKSELKIAPASNIMGEATQTVELYTQEVLEAGQEKVIQARNTKSALSEAAQIEKSSSTSTSKLRLTTATRDISCPSESAIIDATRNRASLPKSERKAKQDSLMLGETEPGEVLTPQEILDARLKEIELECREAPTARITTCGHIVASKSLPPRVASGLTNSGIIEETMKRASLPHVPSKNISEADYSYIENSETKASMLAPVMDQVQSNIVEMNRLQRESKGGKLCVSKSSLQDAQERTLLQNHSHSINAPQGLNSDHDDSLLTRRPSTAMSQSSRVSLPGAHSVGGLDSDEELSQSHDCNVDASNTQDYIPDPEMGFAIVRSSSNLPRDEWTTNSADRTVSMSHDETGLVNAEMVSDAETIFYAQKVQAEPLWSRRTLLTFFGIMCSLVATVVIMLVVMKEAPEELGDPRCLDPLLEQSIPVRCMCSESNTTEGFYESLKEEEKRYYEEFRDLVFIHDGMVDESLMLEPWDVDSCNPTNQALLTAANYVAKSGMMEDENVFQEKMQMAPRVRLDTYVLMYLYAMMEGLNWKTTEHWLDYDKVCSWYGVGCLFFDVTYELILPSNQLHGKIPHQIQYLDSLRFLDLSHNDLSGMIPSQLSRMASLMKLDLTETNLNGTIPVELGVMERLGTLELSNNDLTGTIPHQLFSGSMNALLQLGIANNRISGSIPTEIGQATDLTFLRLQGNEISGTIPTELESLTSLELLNIGNNILNGTIPDFLGSMNRLQFINLSGSGLKGKIPETFCDEGMQFNRKLIIDCDEIEHCSCCKSVRMHMGYVEVECAEELIDKDPEGLNF